MVGENGAGKSTLMKILSGSYSHNTYKGKIFIAGNEKKFSNPRNSEDAGIAMIYQEISLHLDLSVAENIFLGNWETHALGVVDWRQINSKAKQYLDMVKLDVKPEEILRNLSTSQLQLVSIAKALSKEPQILVLDEPTSALTATESETLFDILKKLKDEGITSILISHKLDEVFENADRITVLRDGEVISTTVTEEATREKIIADMVGRKISGFYPKEAVEIGEEVLRIENFTVSHPFNPNKNIVEDVSFDLKKAEILGIAGLVGSGRSELVNAIFGSIRRESGQVYIDGNLVNIKNPSDAINHGIALVTEDRKRDGLIEILSIKLNTTLANLPLLSSYGVMDFRKEKNQAKTYFDRLNIKAPGLDTIVQTLSGGINRKLF